MVKTDTDGLSRYSRQIAFSELGLDGQRRLMRGCVLIVGMGGLGTWAAELLARAGVGFLRLVDNDCVELTNIHRQAFYDEADAEALRTKVESAAMRLTIINRNVEAEPIEARLDRFNIHRLCENVDMILDGTDNFASRFLINDYAIKHGKPWVFAGVVGSEAQVMAIVPGRTPCLRCVLESPPPPCLDPNCRTFGVLAPAVSAASSFQAAEAMKILAGKAERINPYLTKFDLWTNTMHRIHISSIGKDNDCLCCVHREFEFLEP